MTDKLLFVYNADTGFFNLAADIAHKIFSPATYPCSLCALTHGVFSVRKEWAEFVQAAPVPLAFLHRNEFVVQYAQLKATPLPAVFRCSTAGDCKLVFSAEELSRLESLEEWCATLQAYFEKTKT